MNTKNPTIVIVNGANWVGQKLVELLLEQRGNVIVVDDFNEANMPFIKHFSDNKHFVFIEKEKINSLRENFTSIKYFIHLKHDFDTSDDKVTSKSFILNTKFVDDVLSIALEKNSTYILTSSIHLHKDFLLKKNYSREGNKNAYNESDLQDYIERTVQEYIKKAGLNGRIARLGNIYGPGMNLDKDPVLKRVLTDAVFSDEIRIFGDGLDYMYYVYISDAIQGVLKSLFTPSSLGKIYSITNPEEISVLSITNKVLSFQPHAKRIKFLNRKNHVDPLYQKAYIPEENLTEIGWKPLVSFDRGIAQVYEYFKNSLSVSDYEEDVSSDEESDRHNDINFDFDDTINLADTVLAPHAAAEHHQFQEFHKKLNSSKDHESNSFFANLKSKLHLKEDDGLDDFEEKKPKGRYMKFLLAFLIFALVYIFFIIPVFRFGFFFWKLDSAAERLSYYIDHTYQGYPEPKNLEASAIQNFAGVSWAINTFNQEGLESDVINISRGLDKATVAYSTIERSELNKYLITGQNISQEDISKVQDVIILLTSAKSELQNADKINLPFGANEDILKIRDWTNQVEERFSSKLKSGE